MIYLSPQRNLRDEWSRSYWGSLWTPKTGYPIATDQAWAVDCGIYSGVFSWRVYYKWLAKMMRINSTGPLFAVVPDSVCNAIETIYKYKRYAGDIINLGCVAAYVAQDGSERLPIPPTAGCLFVGGSTEWKMGNGAARMITSAKRRGLHVHIGRVNSAKRIRHFLMLGVDTVDGTTLTRGNPQKIRALFETELKQKPLEVKYNEDRTV